jgi:homoserine kinase
MRPFKVSVPATSANLGPGFDAVGIALALRVRAFVEPAAGFELAFQPGPDCPSHDGFANAIVRGMHRIAPRLPSVRVRVANDIPLGIGLGSSAAAAVLGLSIASRAHGTPMPRRRLAHLACELEGHPDNALPAVFGSAVVAASSDARSYVRLNAARNLRALIVIPNVVLSTSDARALLPARYDRADVVFTAQRAALLGAALASGAWNELREAMRDRLHQPYRMQRIPGMEAALALQERGVIGSALSGAGPSLIALLRPRAAWAGIARRLSASFERAGITTRAFAVDLAQRGVFFSTARG